MSEKTGKMGKQDSERREIELRLLEEDIYEVRSFFAPIYVLLFGGLFGTTLVLYVARFLGWQQLFQLSLDGLALVSIAGGLAVMVESILLSFYYTRKIVMSRKLTGEDLVNLVYHVFVASIIIASLGLFVYYVFSRLAVSRLAVSWTG